MGEIKVKLYSKSRWAKQRDLVCFLKAVKFSFSWRKFYFIRGFYGAIKFNFAFYLRKFFKIGYKGLSIQTHQLYYNFSFREEETNWWQRQGKFMASSNFFHLLLKRWIVWQSFKYDKEIEKQITSTNHFRNVMISLGMTFFLIIFTFRFNFHSCFFRLKLNKISK
jgi:hypothetical protein